MLKKIFGSRNDRLLKKMRKTVATINAMEPDMQRLSDADLAAKTPALRERFNKGTSLDDLLPEAFAVAREAGRRALNMRHFDEQLLGGMVLHQGKISEMRTGEGKTLVATLPVYLNALSGKGVHLITVNDYLAERDAAWMGRLYTFLGLTVGVIKSRQEPVEKHAAYRCDITYGTNNEFGFDHLRDNMAMSAEERFQRGLNFAVIDEVDSILIDEARTPLIISGPGSDTPKHYQALNPLVLKLSKQEREETIDEPLTEEERGDFTADEKTKQVYLTEQGHEHVESLLAEEGILQEGESLYNAKNVSYLHYLTNLLRAHHLYQKDVDYIIQDNQIVIVDEFTGRTMPGRRWGEGMHQAMEAKEAVPIQKESTTMAAITYQNYFRMYDKLSGMTGTADTEAFEFSHIYGLEVVVIPTHKPMQRKDFGDVVFLTAEEKFQAIISDIKETQTRQQPILVGTASIEVSEHLSRLLKKEGIKHEVLNAKQHAREASIIEQAGMSGAITIATNMAGRGTDIVLGGHFDPDAYNNDEEREQAQAAWQQRHDAVLKSGGLHIVGTERHESRRVDNQLRGRSGRQGDPGSSRFYLSLQDTLMRIFASERVAGMMKKLGLEEGEAIEHPWVSKAIANAQKKVEGHNFDIRKQLLEYDDVANEQRKIIYEQRNGLIEQDNIHAYISELINEVLAQAVHEYIPAGSIDDQWDVPGLEQALQDRFGLKLPVAQWLDEEESLYEEKLKERIQTQGMEVYTHKFEQAGPEIMRAFEKQAMLHILDTLWREHLESMNHLRQSIGLRGYAQKDPKQEFKHESFSMFRELLDRIRQEICALLLKVQVEAQEDVDAIEEERKAQAVAARQQMSEDAARDDLSQQQVEQQTFKRTGRKMGRNEPCFCGSGRKFKHCHGRQ